MQAFLEYLSLIQDKFWYWIQISKLTIRWWYRDCFYVIPNFVLLIVKECWRSDQWFTPRVIHESTVIKRLYRVLFTAETVILAHFFEDANGAASLTRLTAIRYVGFIFWTHPKWFKAIQTEKIWFQQDGSSAHIIKQSMEIVLKMFPAKMI